MAERWLGLVVSSDAMEAVDLEVPSGSSPLAVQMQETWKLQEGARPAAYRVMFARIADYVKEQGISRVVIKGSALSRTTKMAHLESAELRGVAAAASAQHASVEFSQKAHISRTFGERDTDQYLGDATFWANEVSGELAKGRREAALLVLAKTRPRA